MENDLQFRFRETGKSPHPGSKEFPSFQIQKLRLSAFLTGKWNSYPPPFRKNMQPITNSPKKAQQLPWEMGGETGGQVGWEKTSQGCRKTHTLPKIEWRKFVPHPNYYDFPWNTLRYKALQYSTFSFWKAFPDSASSMHNAEEEIGTNQVKWGLVMISHWRLEERIVWTISSHSFRKSAHQGYCPGDSWKCQWPSSTALQARCHWDTLTSGKWPGIDTLFKGSQSGDYILWKKPWDHSAHEKKPYRERYMEKASLQNWVCRLKRKRNSWWNIQNEKNFHWLEWINLSIQLGLDLERLKIKIYMASQYLK